MKAHFAGNLKAILAIVGNFLGQRAAAPAGLLEPAQHSPGERRTASSRRWVGVSSDADRWWFIMGGIAWWTGKCLSTGYLCR